LLEPIELVWRAKEEKFDIGFQHKGESSSPMHDFCAHIHMVGSKSEDDSRDYKWDSLSEESCHDIEVDTIHTYAIPPKVENEEHMAQSLNSTQTSSEPQQVNIEQAPLFTQWVGEPWVPSWVGDSTLVFNPHAFYPI
jgi:hypothetical protein